MAANQSDSDSTNWKMNIYRPSRSSGAAHAGSQGGSSGSNGSGDGGDDEEEDDTLDYTLDYEDSTPMHVIQRMLPSEFSQEDDEETDNGDYDETEGSDESESESEAESAEGSDAEDFGGFKTSSDSVSDNEHAIASSSDDESIQNEENDFFRNDRLSDSESGPGREEEEDGDDDDEFFDDFFDIEATLQSIPPEEPSFASSNYNDSENDSDSYLWEYFLTSDEDDTFGYVRGRRYSQVDGVPREVSGDSTDEDDSVPPATQRVQGSRAVEVLGVDTFSTRPPVLGQWDINDNKDKQVGIIDGLTTRSLTPLGAPRSADAVDSTTAGPAGATGNTETPSQAEVTPTPKDSTPQPRIYSEALHSDSEYSDVELEEFMNTKDMDLDSEDDTAVSQLSSDNRPKVPLSAFRNRGIQGPQQMAFRRRRSSLTGSGDYMSPLRGLHRKKRRRVRKIPSPKMDQPQEKDNKDFVDELMEVNAISPLFGI